MQQLYGGVCAHPVCVWGSTCVHVPLGCAYIGILLLCILACQRFLQASGSWLLAAPFDYLAENYAQVTTHYYTNEYSCMLYGPVVVMCMYFDILFFVFY